MPMLRSLMVVLSMAVLAGCATTEFAKDPIRSGGSTAGNGTAIASLTINTGEVQQFGSITLDRIDASGKAGLTSFILSNVVPGISRDTSIFVGSLAPGEYRLRQLSTAGKYLPLSDNALSSFRVESGKVTDLGRLVLTAVNFKVMVGRSEKFTDNAELVRAYAPDYAKLYTAEPSLGWNDPRKETDVAEAFALIHPLGAMGFRTLSNGETIGGTRMGTLILRSTEGRWRIAGRTGDLEGFTATAPWEVEDAIAVAGGDMGSLVKLGKDGKIVRLGRGDLPLGSIFFIDHSPDGKQWVVGVQKPGRAALYLSPVLDDGQWREAVSETTEFSSWSGVRSAWAWAYPGGFGFAASASKTIGCFDYATAAWRNATPPGGRTVMGLSSSPDGSIGVLTSPGGGLAGVFAQTHISQDCGATWTPTNSPYKVKAMPSLRLPDGTIVEGGGVFGDKGLYTTTDNKTWKKVSDEDILTDRLWSVSGVLITVSWLYGLENIRTSKDAGATWVTELTSVDRKLLEIQLRKDEKK